MNAVLLNTKKRRLSSAHHSKLWNVSCWPNAGVDRQVVTAALPRSKAFPARWLGPYYYLTQAVLPHQREITVGPLCPPSVLVSLLVQLCRYLFLHQPQLITQVVVDFHELLDLCFRGRESVFHLHEILYSNRFVWLVRVQALLGREWRIKKTSNIRGGRHSWPMMGLRVTIQTAV